MKRTLLVTIAVTVLSGATASGAIASPHSPYDSGVRAKGSTPATVKDYVELLQQLEELSASIKELKALTSGGTLNERRREIDWQRDCRGYGPTKTVRCAAAKLQPEGGVAKALSVWRCESGWGYESQYHSDPYHGPFQYLESTYDGQQARMPDVVRWYVLSPNVHDMRSNILTAVAWAARYGWYPWSCA